LQRRKRSGLLWCGSRSLPSLLLRFPLRPRSWSVSKCDENHQQKANALAHTHLEVLLYSLTIVLSYRLKVQKVPTEFFMLVTCRRAEPRSSQNEKSYSLSCFLPCFNQEG